MSSGKSSCECLAPADRLTLPSLCQGYPLPFVPQGGPHRLTPRSPHAPFQQLRLSTTSFILSWQGGIESCWEKTDLKLKSSLIPVLFLTSDWWIKMILWITVSVPFQSQGWTVITLPVRYTLAKSGFLKDCLGFWAENVRWLIALPGCGVGALQCTCSPGRLGIFQGSASCSCCFIEPEIQFISTYKNLICYKV